MARSRFDLTGRAALVTGGSKGLGKAMARALVEAGADVVISSRNEAELQAALSEISQGAKGRAVYCVADLARRSEAIRLAKFTAETLGGVDILINNAGSNVPQTLDQVRDEDWDRILELNLTSCMALARAVIPGMRDRGWGRIIYTSSILGLGGKAGRSGYCATKAALIGMTRAQALEWGPHGITVNCIAPGPFLTDLPKSLLTPEQQQAFADRTAVARWGQPDEIAGPTLLLASDAGSYITGSTLVVDGGTLCNLL